MKFPKFKGGSQVKDSCQRDRETGNLTCRRVRVHADGTEQELAGFTMNLDGQCNAVADSSFENEEGQLAEIEKKFVPKIIGKCKSTPSDY